MVLGLVTTFAQTRNSMPDFSDQSQWGKLSFCPLCGDGDFHTVIVARDRHYGNPGLFPVVECSNCGLNFLNPMPTLNYLSNAYPTDYYSYAPPRSEIKRSKLRKRVMRALRYLVFYDFGLTRDPKFKTPGTMLDFGCGSGTFLAMMREKGWNVHGVELDPVAAERGRKEGIDIFGGTIDSAGYPSASFDYVRSNHSFEHIHNPREVLREIRRIVKPTGLVFIGVPNVAGMMARFYGTYWWYLGAPVHPFGYSPETLGRLLSESGFKVERVNYNSNFAGIFGSLQLYLNRDNGKLGEDGWITHRRLLMVIGNWAARVIDFLRRGDCIEVIARPV